MAGSLDVARRTLETQLKNVELAKVKGVKVALGTDAGAPGVNHGESFSEEVRLMLAAGYSLEQAVQCATVNGASLLGLENRGALKKGQPADFLVIRATPAMVPRKLSFIEAMYEKGQLLFTKEVKRVFS